MEEQTVDLTPVVACVIKGSANPESLFLLGCRSEEGEYCGLWEFPGGKLEEGETIFAAAIRELKEELDIPVLTMGAEPLFTIIMPKYMVTFVDVTLGELEHPILPMSAHSKVQWVTLSAMATYALTPASAAFVIHLLQQR